MTPTLPSVSARIWRKMPAGDGAGHTIEAEWEGRCALTHHV